MGMGERDIRYEFADFAVYPSRLCFYFLTAMVNNINNFGVINFYENPNSNHHSSSKKEQAKCEDITPENTPSATTPKFFCVSPKFSEQNIRDRIAAELNQSTTKIDFCRALYRLQHIGCIDIDQYSSDEKRAKAFNDYQSTYKLSASDFCKARATRWTQNDAEFPQSFS